MVEFLYVVIYLNGQVAGSIGPLAELPERDCLEIVARTTMLQHEEPKNRRATFACEWHEHRPRVTVEVK
jgi:hypothetical protein